MSRIFIKILMLFLLKTFVNCDWIKISESNSMDHHPKNVSTKSDFLSGILMKTPQDNSQSEPPSKEWIEYQKERSKISGKSNVLHISSVQRLKTSAHVIVPATTRYSSKDINVTKQEGDFRKSSNREMHMVGNVNSAPSKNDSPTDRNNKTHKLNKTKSGKNRGPLLLNRTDDSVELTSMQSFVKFMKSLQNNLIRKTSFGIKDKISKLKSLRDNLLLNIEDRIQHLLETNIHKRRKRGILEESSLDFPTAETALMTINFLTFAVFLIKLVLQVVNTIKSKHYSFNGFAVNSMDTLKIAKSRDRRFVNDMEDNFDKTASILNAVHSLKI